ncbi:MAG: DNA-binding response regulator [bacterium]|nr:DNA-binding response regulator [bacterium]
MNVLIVDDEPLARDWLRRLLLRMDDVRVCGEAASGDDALAKASALEPDLVLLDIQIPGRDGLEVAKALGDTPVVFTTAHSRYALTAFELDACDYLVKPIQYEQLVRSIERARRRRVLLELARREESIIASPTSSEAGTLVVHERGVVRFIDARQVTRFRAADKYTLFRVDGDEQLVRDSLDSLAERLAPLGFIRVHRAELVRKDAVVALVNEEGSASLELSDGQHVAVSRRYLGATKRELGVG